MKGNFNTMTQLTPTTVPIGNVPILDLKRQYAVVKDEMIDALVRVCDSGQFILGPDVKILEEQIAAYCQAEHAIGCASGSDAILLALMAAGVEAGDEVICPSFTFFATASAITRLGATPIFADIDPDSFLISTGDVADKITHKTRAIIPVHLFGQMADMMTINRLACEHGVVVIEDAAQSIGAELDGRRAGSWGDMTALSFYPTKNLGGAGDAGMLTTRNELYAASLRLLRVHGMEPRYYHQVIGINSRLDSFQAAILNVKMRYIDQWTASRLQNADRYTEMFCDERLYDTIVLPTALPNRRHVWNQYTIRVPDGRRDAMRSWLAERKIGSEIYYPLGLHEQECFQYLGYRPTSLPETFQASREVLALPMFPELTEAEQRLVVDGVQDFYEHNAARRHYPVAA
ncbi:MAG: DegT/DnrJ/EryC1/StrS family aminotransferase [Thermoguttaceae bacterium]